MTDHRRTHLCFSRGKSGPIREVVGLIRPSVLSTATRTAHKASPIVNASPASGGEVHDTQHHRSRTAQTAPHPCLL